MQKEENIWNGSPSQVTNFGVFLIYGLLFWFVFPLFIILWKWLTVKSTKYELTSQRLKTKTGVLNRTTNELELYRVKDYKMEQPFFLRFFSLSNIVLDTSDSSHPTVRISAIENGEQLREQIRTAVESCRQARGVKEVDFS